MAFVNRKVRFRLTNNVPKASRMHLIDVFFRLINQSYAPEAGYRGVEFCCSDWRTGENTLGYRFRQLADRGRSETCYLLRCNWLYQRGISNVALRLVIFTYVLSLAGENIDIYLLP